MITLASDIHVLEDVLSTVYPDIASISLRRVLFCKNLRIEWKDTKLDEVMISPDHDSVNIGARAFIKLFVNAMHNFKPQWIPAIGREALQWTLLSDDLDFSNRSMLVYSTILEPLDNYCLRSLLEK